MENNEDWHEKRVDFYQNSGALEFINDYFDVKKGVRFIVGHEKPFTTPKRYEYGYEVNHSNDELRALTIPDYQTKKFTPLKKYWCIHSNIYTFDKSMLNWIKAYDRENTFANNRVGINAIIDLDSPDDPNIDKAKRLTFFDHNQQFDDAINIIDKKLDELGENYNLMFSGNGIYVMLEGYYEDNFLQYRDDVINLVDDLKENHDLDNKNKVHIDNKSFAWSFYYKIPFTFHDKRDRISIPLPKGEIDIEWLNEVSNSNNILNDYTLVSKITKKSNWNKIW